MQCTSSLPGGSGQCNSCNALPHCLGQWAEELLQCTASRPGAMGSGTPAMHCLTASGPAGSATHAIQRPDCLWAVGDATLAIHCLMAWGRWVVQLVQCTTSLPCGSGQCNSCSALPHCPRAVGSGNPAMRYLTAWGIGQWNSSNTLPHCRGAARSATHAMQRPHPQGVVGGATPAIQCLTAWRSGQ